MADELEVPMRSDQVKFNIKCLKYMIARADHCRANRSSEPFVDFASLEVKERTEELVALFECFV